MLVESGFVRATAGDGSEYTFRPSFGRIAALGTPHEIVALYAGLHGPNAEAHARYVLALLSDQEDATPLIGWIDESGDHAGVMPGGELVIIARHLMQHGMVGTATPARGDGKFSETFEAAEYVAAAQVHLGLSEADAEALSMTQFQLMFAMKFPDAKKASDVPTREEYEASLAAIMAIRKAKGGSDVA